MWFVMGSILRARAIVQILYFVSALGWSIAVYVFGRLFSGTNIIMPTIHSLGAFWLFIKDISGS